MIIKKITLIMCMLVAVAVQAQNAEVLFSANGGFYEDVFELEMFSTAPQGRIFFTINGNMPTVQSRRYTEPILLDTSLYSKSDIYTIVNSIPSFFYLPDSVQHAIVIRAAVFDDRDSCISKVKTNSYFIRSLGCDFHGLPVLSITTDSLNLFDYETGIFVPGVNYNPVDSFGTGNYCMKGREWERLINMEFYEPDNQGINQECGLRTHGGASRWFQQKGLKLYARDEYGKKRFKHSFFDNTPVANFKHLNLHPFRCSNWFQTGGQEYLSQIIAGNLNMESMGVRQTVLFINGEYWGIYTLEEAADERYLEDHFDVDLDSVVVIKYWGVPNYGNPTDWRNFYSWIQEADLSQPEDSAYAYSHVDVPCLIDYFLFETFSANLDWPSNNVKIWQPAQGTPFRWIFYDGDGCFTQLDYDAVGHALNQDGCSYVFLHFLENNGFRLALIQRFEELTRSYFSYDSMKAVLDEYGQIVEGEIDAQSQRFGFPIDRGWWDYDMWRADLFLHDRETYFRNEISDYLFIKQPDGITAFCYPNPASDVIHVRQDAGTSGVTEIAIYDVLGRKVFAYAVDDTRNDEITIQPNLKAGIYVLKAGGRTQKIVIQ